MIEQKLSTEEITSLINELVPKVQQIIVCESLHYIETKEFERDNSVYHIFGAYNRKYDCWQKVTYSPTGNSLEFTLHSIECNIKK